jgi:hypothetical protein
MFRRFVISIPLVALAGVLVSVSAAERVTIITDNGQRMSGSVASHGAGGENRDGSFLTLTGDNGQEQRVQLDRVAIIDFAGDAPSESEIQGLPSGSTNVLVLRNGQKEQGTFVDMYGGDKLKFRNQSGTVDYAIRDVSRIYMNPQNARTALNGATNSTVGTAGQNQTVLEAGAVRVEANQPWTSTGITVRKGDRVAFRTTGQIAFSRDLSQMAGPDGNNSSRNPAFPVVAMPVGGLIGKIGNGPAFAIGSNSQPLVMQTDGVLMLGVNDTEFSDNSGFFSVVVTKG